MKLYFDDGNIVDVTEISHAIVDHKEGQPSFTITFENFDSSEVFVSKVKEFIKHGEYLNVFHSASEDAQVAYTVSQLIGFTI